MFENPKGYWEHQGSFLVELVPETPTDHVPSSATVEGNVVRVKHGRIKQTMGGIQFYAEEKPFAWGYRHIKEIRDGKGSLIWQNYDYRS